MRYLPLLAVAALALFAGSQAQAQNFSGSVHGTNTVDYISRTNTVAGETVQFTVTASGGGTNKLKVEVQVLSFDTNSYHWVTIRQIYVSPGSSSTSSFTVGDDPDHNEYVRYRISRKIGTQRIDYVGVEQ